MTRPRASKTQRLIELTEQWAAIVERAADAEPGSNAERVLREDAGDISAMIERAGKRLGPATGIEGLAARAIIVSHMTVEPEPAVAELIRATLKLPGLERIAR